MRITQVQSATEQLEPQVVLLQNNPFVPSKGGICLINDLPPELLSHTFELGFVDDVIEDEEDIDNRRAVMAQDKPVHDRDTESRHVFPPFTLAVSNVCQHWRNVALSTPAIWTTIVVTPEERPPYNPISTLLERSKSHSIDITISYDDLDEYQDELPSDADLETLFAMLIPHVRRWRTMKFTVSEYHHMYAFLSAVSHPSVSAAPQLTTLELYHYFDTRYCVGFQHPEMAKHLTLFAGSAPLLTKIVLWGVHVDWDQPWLASASNLTHLELFYHDDVKLEDFRPSWAQFSTILRSASALQKLSIRMSGPSGEPSAWFIEPTSGSPADVNAPIQLVRLTDFDIEYETMARSIGLLRRLYLPSLNHLSLAPRGTSEDDFGDLFRELVRPALPHSLASRLESLAIPALLCDVECIETLYGELQNLRVLVLSLYYSEPIFLDIISTPCTLPGRGDIWLPRLSKLYVYGPSGISLRTLVSQRKEAGVPLSYLYVDRGCGLDDEDVDWLKENVRTFEFFARPLEQQE